MFFKRRKFPDLQPRTEQDDFILLARMSDDRYFVKQNFYETLKETPGAATWKDAKGTTGLMAAAQGGENEHIASLISAGAEIDARDENGDTALIHAARGGHAEVVALLLDNGAGINAANNKGETALIAAAGEHNREALALLIRRGANLELRTAAGKTALQTAEEHFNAAAAETQTMFNAVNTDGPLITLLRNGAAAKETVTELLNGADHSVTVHKPLKLTLKH